MDILRPYILPVPQERQALRGRDRSGQLSRLARRAVQLSAERSGAVLEAMHSRPDGCPIPENGIFWSLSHKPAYVAGVVANGPVGIDVEPVRPVERKLLHRVADEMERSLSLESDLFFFRLWTAKEAVVKAAGGRYPDIFRCRVIEIPDERNLIVRFGNKRWAIGQFYFDDHVAAVVTNGMPVDWRIGTIQQGV